MVFLMVVITVGTALDYVSISPVERIYALNSKTEALVGESVEKFASTLEYNPDEDVFEFNEFYTPGSTTSGLASRAQYRANLYDDAQNGGVEVIDVVNNVSVSMISKDETELPGKNGNRVVYPLKNYDAERIYTLGASSVKEDLVLNSHISNTVSFDYELKLSDGLEPRLEQDGSIGIYGVNHNLLGDVTASSDSDAELLEKARQNGNKNYLVFRIPAPFIVEFDKNSSQTLTYYTLEGNDLTLHATNLDDANYPLTIDPSIYIETAAKLMRGNNETNVDFDVTNELIQKSQTTGARIDSWNSTMALPEGRWDGQTVTAGGYIYYSGGVYATVTADTIAYVRSESANATSDSIDIGTADTNRLVLVYADDESSGTNLTNVQVDGNDCNTVEVADNSDGLGNHQELWYCDEDDLGSSNGTVTYSISGGDGGWGIAAHLYTGVSQSGPSDSGHVDTETSQTTTTVTGIDVPEDGLVAMGAGHGSGGSWSSYTSPLTERTDANYPSSAVFATSSGIETTAQTNKSYTSTASESGNRLTGIVAAWDHGVTLGAEDVNEELYWAELDNSNNTIISPNPGQGACTNWCTETVYDLPDERRGHSMVAYNGYLYVIGGENSAGTRQSTIYIAELGANGEPALWHPTDTDKTNWDYWHTDTGLSSGTARSYLSAVAYNNRMYVLGGQTNATPGGVTTVEVADINPNGTLGTWTTTGMQALPSGAGTHMMGAHFYNDTLYVLGGFEGVSTSSANLRDAVYYSRVNDDGTMNTWQSTDAFSTARATFGGTFSYIWGAYIYMGGGCEAVNGSGYCTTISSDMQLASINADGSLDQWSSLGSLTNDRIGYSLIGWQNGIYRISGCSSVDSGNGECTSYQSGVDYGTINPAGEVSTVNISEPSGTAPCNGATPHSCDLPDVGEGSDEIGQLLAAVTILNGYLYVIGGCVDYNCNGTSPASTNASPNTAYVAIDSQGLLTEPATCSGTYAGSWCVDSTNLINDTGSATTDGVAAAGVTTFGNRIYVIGGRNGEGVLNDIHHNAVNNDGSLDGAWESNDMTTAGFNEDIAYTWAFTRANPASAGTDPGNLFVFGGCGNDDLNLTCGTAAANYETEVYKCDIETDGDISGCTTSGQLQIDSDPDTGGSQGLGIHAGALNANYVYLIGGYSDTEADKDEVMYAQIDDSNNIVAVSGGIWQEDADTLSIGRRRGAAFGYNGHIYAVGGYDAGQGVLPFIEWSKMDVSDGSIDAFVTSSIEINQRWGLAVTVSNSYAYVIGGCDVGASPDSCSSFEPQVQTFQLYNNDSGAVDNFTAASDQTFDYETDRWGASSIVYDGYIYVAGGCVSATDCTEATNNVQYAPISAADGSIGTWSSTSMNLPQNRAWGELLEAGGSLYYVGGEDSSSDEKSDVYYVDPEVAGSAEDVFRVTTYKIDPGEYTGGTYTLTLNNDLSENYFTMISGAGDTGSNQGSDEVFVRVEADPFGNIGTATAADELDLSRDNGGSPGTDWVGTVTVVECLIACGTDGFQLREVTDTALAAGTANALQTVTQALEEDHTDNTVPFGGYYGGGLESADAGNNQLHVTGGVRLLKSGTNDITIERYGGESRVPGAADLTMYIVEWGSNWTIQESHFVDWNVGGGGANADCSAGDPEYTCNTITSVTRDDTWVWKSPGTSEADGLGDGAFGKVFVLGDGVNQAATETELAIGSEHEDAGEVRRDTGYVLTHNDLATDYRFNTDAAVTTSRTTTVDNATGSETYNTSGNISTTEGYRIPLYYHSESGEGQSTARVAAWSLRHTATGTVTQLKSRSGNSQAGWMQSIDFNAVTYTPTDGDLADWRTASNGLVADRTKFGAASWNDRLYVVGGLDDSASDTNTVYYSPQLSSGGDITSAWSSSTTFDVAREGAAVTAYANNLYLFGGYDGANYLSDVQFTQINTDGTVDAWSNTISLPDGLREARAFSANGYMYLVGGRSADTTCVPNTLISPIVANTTIATGNNPTGIGDWYETNVRYTGDRYGAAVAYDDGTFYTMGGGCTSPLSSNRHYESTVLSQPQVAKYSRLIDTDTDVFPNAWLLNGLDNSIGARWRATYRSMNDTDGIPADCGSADMTTFGQSTTVEEVTLGDVMVYTPLDGSGTDIECARYFYFFIEIDASRTFGYPEDVNRGPTIDDLTLFFTSDPGKRLRHGKTFTGGEKQPLDTPCRQSVDTDCPLP